MKGKKAISYLMMQPGMTSVVMDDLLRKTRRLMDISRDKPPAKGAFIHYLKKKGQDKLLSWTLNVKRRVIRELERLSTKNIGWQSLLEMENFQFNQKGPMAPIEARTVVKETIPKIVTNSELKPDPSAKAKLLGHISTVEKRYGKYMSFGNIDLNVLDFENAWRTLPSSSVRGIPFLLKGSEVDGLIMQIYGKNLKSVLNQFVKLESLITTPGLRIQGSPKWDHAKVRLINIPSVNYQYMMNGLYQSIKNELIKVPSMSGWLTPLERDKAIVNMCVEGSKMKMVPVPLDFRAFDTHMFEEFRLEATKLLLKVFKNSNDLQTIHQVIERIYKNQYLWGPSLSERVALYPVNNLLGSGVANTQADGSTMNMALQCYFSEILGYEQPDNLGLTLGDDVVMWVPKSIMDDLGYEGVLHKINDSLKPLNMEIHVKKKYPLPQVMFLQRLYVPEQEIIGEYSLVRSVDSIVWAESFRSPIEGVINHMALETIGQISTLNNSMQGVGKISLKQLAYIVVSEWLKVDQGLCYLAQLSSKTSSPSASLFGYLVRATGGLDAIIRAYKLEQYDHKGLLELFKNNSSDSFPIIDVIIEEARKLPIEKVSLKEIYGLSDSDVGKAPPRSKISENIINDSLVES